MVQRENREERDVRDDWGETRSVGFDITEAHDIGIDEPEQGRRERERARPCDRECRESGLGHARQPWRV